MENLKAKLDRKNGSYDLCLSLYVPACGCLSPFVPIFVCLRKRKRKAESGSGSGSGKHEMNGSGSSKKILEAEAIKNSPLPHQCPKYKMWLDQKL